MVPLAGAGPTIRLRPSHSLTTTALPLRARHAPLPTPRFAIWRFLLVAALPFLLVFMAAASCLGWMCFQGVVGPALSLRWPPSRLWQPLYDGIRAWLLVPRYRSSRCWGWLGWYGLSSRCWLWRLWHGCDGTRHYASCLMSAVAIG